MQINVPHIHKIEGDAGFWARVTKEGRVEELKLETLEGLRQIEGLLIGRRFDEIPTVVSRVCGICPVVHILNACSAIEKALNLEVSPSLLLLRKLMLGSQIIQSHTLHLFFMALPDFLDIENDLELKKKFPKEAKAALNIRDYSLEIIRILSGRAVHPLTFQIGRLTKPPDKEKLKKLLEKQPAIKENAQLLVKTFQKINYPDFKRKTKFASLFSEKEYPICLSNIEKIGEEKFSIGDFYSDEIEEDLKNPPVKRVKFKGQPYMLGSIARIKNNGSLLLPLAKAAVDEFRKTKGEEIFDNVFHNLFFQAVDVLHFIEESEKLLKEIINSDLRDFNKDIKINKGSGLSAMEAPRGTLFTYFELDDKGRVLDCNIITPTAQFLNNLEADLKAYLPNLLGLPEKTRIKKIRSLIRVYDPCISCATH